MGKIESQISGDLTIRKVIGTLTIDELMNDVKEFYAGQPTKFVLLDLSAGSIATLTVRGPVLYTIFFQPRHLICGPTGFV